MIPGGLHSQVCPKAEIVLEEGFINCHASPRHIFPTEKKNPYWNGGVSSQGRLTDRCLFRL